MILWFIPIAVKLQCPLTKMLKKIFRRGAKISDPMECTHQLHIDSELNWSLDESVDPKTVFVKLKIIGKGGFGTVSQIAHVPSMTVLAGKLINSNLVNESSRRELEHEIELMREVDSRYTVRYYGCIAYEGSLMILMEYCDRGSLRDILDKREQVLSEDQIALVMHDLLMGLSLIHKKHRIVHRDIKAANLLLTSKGDIKIADFGVSRRFEASGTCHTMSMVGTPYWMAPEVISGISYSFPADIWSVGVTAIELAEGSPPYVEFAPTKAMVEIAVKGFPGYRFPTMHSPEFCDFVSHCLEKNPRDRWTIEELLEHPFIKRAERLDRMEVLEDLLDESLLGNERFNSDYQTNGDMDMFSESNRTNDSIDGLNTARNITMSDNMFSFEGAAMMMSRNFNNSMGMDSPFGQGMTGSSFANAGLGSIGESFMGNSLDLKSGNNFQFENSMASFSSQQSAMDSFDFGDSPFLQQNCNSSILESNNVFSNDNSINGSQQSAIDSLYMGDSPFLQNENNNVPSSILKESQSVSNELPQDNEHLKESQKQNETKKQSSSSKTVHFSKKINKENSSQTISINNLPDKLYVKVSRAMSIKIPYIPIKVGSNNDAEVHTLYQKRNISIPVTNKKRTLFDNDGIIIPTNTLYSKKFHHSFALIILFFAFFFLKRDSFISLIGLCYITALLTLYFKKDKPKKSKKSKHRNSE